jgi:hypothetical protein
MKGRQMVMERERIGQKTETNNSINISYESENGK